MNSFLKLAINIIAACFIDLDKTNASAVKEEKEKKDSVN
jgi:hypothetical protein